MNEAGRAEGEAIPAEGAAASAGEREARLLHILIRVAYLPLLAALALWARGGVAPLARLSLGLYAAAVVLLAILGEWLMARLRRELLFYLFFGALTTLVAQLSFNGVNYLISGGFAGRGGYWWLLPKTVSWCAAVLFAFVSNRRYVFAEQAERGAFWPELARFVLGRIGSGLLIEYLGMFLLVNVLALGEALANLISSVLVVLANYAVSRLFVFRARAKRGPGRGERPSGGPPRR